LAQDDIPLNGHAFEARIYAENPQEDFKPSPGTLHTVQFATGCRIDTGVQSGDAVSPFYDPMVAKITTHGADRMVALAQLIKGLDETLCTGIDNNIGFLSALASDADFANGVFDTGLIARKQDALTQVNTPDVFDVAAGFLALHETDMTAPRLGWGLWAQIRHPLNMIYDGEVLEGGIQFDGSQKLTITLDETQTSYDDVSCLNDRVMARSSGTKHTAMIATSGTTAYVKSSADQYEFHAVDPFTTGSAHTQNLDQVTSPMTGVVTVVHVAAGQTVETGAPLFAVEAMKMEHVVTAEQDGVIETVLCAAADAVDQGQLLVQFVKTDT